MRGDNFANTRNHGMYSMAEPMLHDYLISSSRTLMFVLFMANLTKSKRVD